MRDATQATSSGKIVSKLLRIFGKKTLFYPFMTSIPELLVTSIVPKRIRL